MRNEEFVIKYPKPLCEKAVVQLFNQKMHSALFRFSEVMLEKSGIAICIMELINN